MTGGGGEYIAAPINEDKAPLAMDTVRLAKTPTHLEHKKPWEKP